MSSNLVLNGQQATLTVHSMLRRTNLERKTGDKVTVVVNVADKSPPKTTSTLNDKGIFENSIHHHSDDFLTRLEFDSKLELFLQAQTNLVAACEKLRQENQQYREEYMKLQRKVYALEELFKNEAQMTTRYNVMDNSLSNMNKEIGRILENVTFLTEDQDKCNVTIKQMQQSFSSLRDKIESNDFQKTLVRRAVSSILKGRQMTKIQSNVAYNVKASTDMLHRMDVAEKEISKIKTITADMTGYKSTIEQMKQRTTLLETSSTLRPLELLQLNENGEEENSDVSGSDDDGDENIRVKQNSDIYNRLDMLEKANFSLRLAMSEKVNRNFKKNKILQQQIDSLKCNDNYEALITNLKKMEQQIHKNGGAVETFKSIINNLVIDLDGQKNIQNKEILRLDRQLRLSSTIVPGHSSNDTNCTSSNSNLSTSKIPNFMRPKGFKKQKQSLFAKQAIYDNQMYGFKNSPEIYHHNNYYVKANVQKILVSNANVKNTPKIQIRIPSNSKEREPYKRSNVKIIHNERESKV